MFIGPYYKGNYVEEKGQEERVGMRNVFLLWSPERGGYVEGYQGSHPDLFAIHR